MACFGLKLGQDLGNRAAQPYRKFQGVPTIPDAGIAKSRVPNESKALIGIMLVASHF